MSTTYARILATVGASVTAASVTVSGALLEQREQPKHVTSPDENAKAYAITQRLRSGLDARSTRVRPGSDRAADQSIKVSTMFTKEAGYLFSKDGLPIARIATAEIDGDIDAVADLFKDSKGRKSWDKTASDAYSTVSKDDGISYHYLRGRAGWVAPARDFVYTTVELPAAVVGINDIRARVFFNRDCSDKIPLSRSWNVVRGEQNSLLVLQPSTKGHSKTQATLLVECHPRGWANVFGTGTMDWLAGDSTVQTLKHLKAAVEADTEDDAGLSVTAAAQRRFNKKRQQEKNMDNSIVEDLSPAAREDLLATTKLLEERLAKLVKDERDNNIDLSPLKARVKADLAKAWSRL